MFRRGLVWLPIACAPALAACSLLLGEGFSDPNVQPPNDSGTSSTDAPANGGDGAPNPNQDGGRTTDESLPTFDGGKLACPDASGVFCDDFERDDVKGSWEAVGITDGGSMTIVEPAGGSRRLEAAISAAGASAQLTRDFTTITPTRIHIELTLDIQTLPSQGAVYLAGVMMLNAGNSPSLIYLYVHGGGAFFVEQIADGVNYVQTALAITIGAPHRVVMDVTLGGKALVSVDGATQVDKATETWLVGKPPRAILGPGSVNGGNALSMRVDDYVFIAE